MKPNPDIALELKGAGITLPAAISGAPYTVPDGYFEGFAEAMLRLLKRQEAKAELEELSPLLAGIPKSMPFAVPHGYFEAAPAPSILDTISRELPFSVPAGYFEGLPEQVLSRVAPQEAKVVRMRPRWIRMAAAAVVAGALAAGGWIYESRVPSATSANPEALVQRGLQSVPDQALEDFIETTDPGSASVAATGNTHSEVHTMLKDVPVSEMDAFLEQVPLDDVSDIN